jgi:outer membrane protein
MNLFRIFFLSLFFLMIYSLQSLAQQDSAIVWSIEECLRYAREHNIALKQAEVSYEIAGVNLRESQMSRLPSLNATVDYGGNFGRTIDPVTNAFETQSITSNRFSLSAGMPLYSGNRILSNIKRNQAELEAGKQNLKFTEIQQLNAVSEAYLNALLASDQLEALRKSRQITQNQLDQTKKLIAAGVLPENDIFTIQAQLARDEQAVVASNNSLEAAKLSLKALLNLQGEYQLEIERPDIDVPQDVDLEAFTFSRLYSNGVSAAPQILSSKARVESARLGIPVARSGMLPSLSVFGSLFSNYSSRTQNASISGIAFSQPQTVIINNEFAEVQFPQSQFTFSDVPYTDQLRDNFGQQFGFRLNLPIFNQFSIQSSVQRAKLGALNAELSYQQSLQSLSNDIQQTLAAARAAQARYQVALLSLRAQQAAFDNASKRFELGALNAIDYATSKMALEQAQLESIQAKYNYLYQLKTLEWALSDFSEPVRFF